MPLASVVALVGLAGPVEAAKAKDTLRLLVPARVLQDVPPFRTSALVAAAIGPVVGIAEVVTRGSPSLSLARKGCVLKVRAVGLVGTDLPVPVRLAPVAVGEVAHAVLATARVREASRAPVPALALQATSALVEVARLVISAWGSI